LSDARRASADDRDLFVFGHLWPRGQMAILAVIVRGALEPADRDGLAIYFVAAADRLARSRAGAAKDARNHVRAAVEHIRLVEAPLRDQADVVRNVGARGTTDLARNIRFVPVRIHFLGLIQRVESCIRVNHRVTLSHCCHVCDASRVHPESAAPSGILIISITLLLYLALFPQFEHRNSAHHPFRLL